MATRCYLVSCVGKKVDHRACAKDLYASDWFLKARGYVEHAHEPWFILSAEYGLLHPDTVVAPYEKTLNRMGVEERRAWATRVKAQLDAQLPRRQEEIVVLAGARYREFLMSDLRQRADRVVVPLEGLRIGEQLSWLSAHSGDDA